VLMPVLAAIELLERVEKLRRRRIVTARIQGGGILQYRNARVNKQTRKVLGDLSGLGFQAAIRIHTIP
jgi:hypothetical protein